MMNLFVLLWLPTKLSKVVYCGYPQKPLFYEVFFREIVIQLFPTNHSKSSFRQVEKINHQKNMLSAVQKIIKI